MQDKVNILIVDDKPEKLLALEAVLEDLGQNVIRAYSGREALRALLNQDFAVILLDVNMPGMDGFETASLIRQRRNTEHIPIIFVTAFSDENHSSRGYSLGAVDYIQTPVLPDVLKTKVSVFVDLYRKTEQVKRQADSLRRRAVQLQKVAAASLAINSAMTVEKTLQTVTDAARDVIGAHQAITLCLTDPYPGQRAHPPTAVTSFSSRYAEWRGRKLDLTRVASSIVAQSRTPTRMNEAELREHPDWEIVKQLDIPPIRGGILAAPFVGRDGKNIGILYLAERADGEFTSDDEAVLVQLAQMASIAIENTIFAEEREANRLKDEFLSVLSHELRTPLNAILGWTQLLKMDCEPGKNGDELPHALDVIERNARAQAKLIEDLLDVSRVTTGKLRLNKRAVSLAAIVNAAVDVVRPAAEAKQIALGSICTTLDDPARDQQDRVSGDPDRLQQVIWNLLSNAVKFTPQGGRIDVRLDRVNSHLRLRVTDTGQGISNNFLPYVFDRFRQADSTSTRSQGGLGIGLTIVRHIVELHGGTVHAESPGEGQGATFTVNLPASETAAVEPPAPLEQPQSMNCAELRPENLPGIRRCLDGVCVLLVDDARDAREVLAEVLRRAGAFVMTAGSAIEALGCLSKKRPHVLVSDIAMPDRDGYDLIRSVRDLPEALGGRVPAIALTAYAREEDRLRSISAGFQAHLAKPVAPGELIATVSHLGAEQSPIAAHS